MCRLPTPPSRRPLRLHRYLRRAGPVRGFLRLSRAARTQRVHPFPDVRPFPVGASPCRYYGLSRCCALKLSQSRWFAPFRVLPLGSDTPIGRKTLTSGARQTRGGREEPRATLQTCPVCCRLDGSHVLRPRPPYHVSRGPCPQSPSSCLNGGGWGASTLLQGHALPAIVGFPHPKRHIYRHTALSGGET